MVLRLAQLPTPQPGPDEVLIRVLATTVSSGDARMRALRFPAGLGVIGRLVLGWNRPRRPVFGTEVAGVVAARGNRVTRFAIGDRVIAFPDLALGAHAEYLKIAAAGMITPLPPRLTVEEGAALCFGGLTARSFLVRARGQQGERILILGAGGTVGSAMAQLARHIGLQVTAQTSAGKATRLRQLGVGRVIDRAMTDFRTLDERWDIIADTVGASSLAECLPLLAPGGRYLAIAGGLSEMLARPRQGRRVIAGPAKSSPADLTWLAELARSGGFRPAVDCIVPFEDLPAAHAVVDGEAKFGSAVVRVAPG